MRKIITLFLLGFIPVAACAAGVSYTVQNTPKGVHANTGNVYNKSLLHTNEGIKGNYEVIRSQNSTGLIKPTTLTNTVNSSKTVPSTPIKPAVPNYRPTQRYLPALYTFGWSNANDDDKQEINVQNNTYNYYGTAPDNTKNQTETKNEEVKKEEVKKADTKKTDINAEREALRKKYANILSNKTMSNEKMCSKMETYFKDSDYYELDHILNEVLLLNCDIDKLRPDGVIK